MRLKCSLLGAVASLLTVATSASALTVQPQIKIARSTSVGQVVAGNRFYVTDGVHGVRAGDRLGLEVLWQNGWHFAGSWSMHAGQRHFRGYALTGQVGLFTLRLGFVHHRKLLARSFSNRFQLRVTPRVPPPGAIVAPQFSKAAKFVGPIAKTATVLPGWDTIQCAVDQSEYGGIGLNEAVDFHPPFNTLGDNVNATINQVIWERKAFPGAPYNNWAIVHTNEQTLSPPQYNTEVYIGNDQASSEELPDWFEFVANHQSVWHQFAWDMQIYENGVGWVWQSPTWFTPGSYIQYPGTEAGPGAQGYYEPTCFTFAS
jgi:hypothetical protein